MLICGAGARVRLVDVKSMTYRIARHYMLRLTTKDLADADLVDKMCKITKLTPDGLKNLFAPVAARFGDLPPPA